MGIFDRVYNLGKGWVKVRRKQWADPDPGVPLEDLASPARVTRPRESVEDLIDRAQSTAREASGDRREPGMELSDREHLARIDKALEDGLLTREQYERKRAELLGEPVDDAPREIKRTL